MSIDLKNAHTICKLVKNPEGEIIGYELENGEKIPKEQAITLAKQGAINGVSVSVSRKGEEFLRSLPDDTENNNLSSLPVITGDQM